MAHTGLASHGQQAPSAKHVGGLVLARVHSIGSGVDDRVDVLHGQLEPSAGDEVALDPVVAFAFGGSAAQDSRAMTGVDKTLPDRGAQGPRSTVNQPGQDGKSPSFRGFPKKDITRCTEPWARC